MGSEGYKPSESECVRKCDSSWCVSQAETAALPWPGKRGSEDALYLTHIKKKTFAKQMYASKSA